MPRPREFDEEAALDAATAQFWSRGYEATSVRDLAATMGLTAASLYNAFGDKRSLYERALERYVEHGFRERVRRFEHHLPPRDAIAAFFDEIIRLSVNDPHRKGCLIVNSAMELAPHDKGFHRALNGVLKDMEGFFARCVAAGQKDGSIPSELDASDMARALLASLMGLRVLARVNPKRDLLEGAARPVLALIGVEPRARRKT
jgi:TetR/AcrR family transcriptional repressor of nem operon